MPQLHDIDDARANSRSSRDGPSAFARHLYRCVGLLLLLCFCGEASAQIWGCSTGGRTANYTFSMPTSLDIDSDAAVGAVLWTSPISTSPQRVVARCPDSNGDLGGFDFIAGLRVPYKQVGGFYVFNSNIPGIGISIALSDVQQGVREWPQTHKTSRVLGGEITSTLRLIKTGAIAEGRLTLNGRAKEYTIGRYRLGAGTTSFGLFRFGSTALNVKPGGGNKTCDINVGDVNKSVTLPSVNIINFPSVGSVAGAVNFSITVEKCSENVNAARFVFNGTPSPSDSRYFANNGSASGVALRLSAQRDGTLVTPTGSTASLTEPVSTTSRQGRLLMVAEYVRTGAMQPGRLRAITTVTVSYP